MINSLHVFGLQHFHRTYIHTTVTAALFNHQQDFLVSGRAAYQLWNASGHTYLTVELLQLLNAAQGSFNEVTVWPH